jgi:CheY-like chemotaxis protein
MLQRRHGHADTREGRLIAGALQSAERAKTLVARLLGFARRQPLQTGAVDLPGLTKGMRDLVSSSLGLAIEVRISCGADLVPALADGNQLELAIVNLAVNVGRNAEWPLKSIASWLLRDLGHEVVEASGGAQALGKLGARLQVDAVVTDYRPRMSGAELAARIRAAHPGRPILLITGYTDLTAEVSDLPRLANPFRQADLSARLEALFGGASNVVNLADRR